MDVEVFRVVDVLVWACLNSIDDLPVFSIGAKYTLDQSILLVPNLAEWLVGYIAYRRTVHRVVSGVSWQLLLRNATHLVEEDILSVSTFSRKVFQIAILVDSMFQTQLLPELRADCVATVS